MRSDDDYGLTPREWLDSDPVPLTPDIDFSDPEQRIAWIRANNEEMYARSQELAQRRGRDAAGDGDGRRGQNGSADGEGRRRTTTVVGVRLLNAEQRALVPAARREQVTVSDLLRRWARAGLAAANGVEPDGVDDRGTPEPGTDAEETAADRAALRQAAEDAADAAVERITDELRRLREIVVGAG